MAPEAIARLASVSFALFAVYGWLGLLFSTPLVGTIVSPIVATTPLFSLVFPAWQGKSYRLDDPRHGGGGGRHHCHCAGEVAEPTRP